MIGSLTIQTPSRVTMTIRGAWSERPPCGWNWTGGVLAPEPIVGISFLQVGDHVEWVRSTKRMHCEMEIHLLLGRQDIEGREVRPAFGVGDYCEVRWRTLLDHADALPSVASDQTIAAGQAFSFCSPFGTPEVALYGLVLLRRQVVVGRGGIWHLKPEYSSVLEEPWRKVLTYARSGAFETNGKSKAAGSRRWAFL